jgi:hypothetical protein
MRDFRADLAERARAAEGRPGRQRSGCARGQASICRASPDTVRVLNETRLIRPMTCADSKARCSPLRSPCWTPITRSAVFMAHQPPDRRRRRGRNPLADEWRSGFRQSGSTRWIDGVSPWLGLNNRSLNGIRRPCSQFRHFPPHNLRASGFAAPDRGELIDGRRRVAVLRQ